MSHMVLMQIESGTFPPHIITRKPSWSKGDAWQQCVIPNR